jgi:8-oxo-dGTP diphosphatase
VAFTEPRLGCGAAIVVGGRILLLLRLTEPEAGCWGLPGGKVDLYETVSAAVEREIREELGVAIEAKTLLCLVDQIDAARGHHWFAPVYLVTTLIGEPRIVEPEKHGGLGWFAIDAVPDALTYPTVVALHTLRERQLIQDPPCAIP